MQKKNSHLPAIAVAVHNVSKRYTLHHEKPTFIETVTGRTRAESFTALESISLNIFQGEKVAILGRNGSGKTTLLKVIAGITTPTDGKVTSQGKIVSLIDLEAGFHPDLTGEENIFLNGLLVGMTRREIRQKFSAIVSFADIGDFIDTPLYTYSEGMKLRLGFAVAVHADPDILILDEGITVGDANFRKKAERKIEEFFKAKKTILVVTHWEEFLRKNCQRFIWLDGGVIKADGGTGVIDVFMKGMKKRPS